jgi:hypothetical protein
MTLTIANAPWTLRVRAGMPVLTATHVAAVSVDDAPATGFPRVPQPPRMAMRV